jgi:hypothetical protein
MKTLLALLACTLLYTSVARAESDVAPPPPTRAAR